MNRLGMDVAQDLIRDRAQGGVEVVVAMSGGVDSGLVAALAVQAVGSRARAVTIQSEFVARQEIAAAKSIAEHVGIRHELLEMHHLESAAVRRNGPDRCYHCKGRVFERLQKKFHDAVLCDGTNGDDDPARPGLKALAERGVMSPLRLAGVTKANIRSAAKVLGLPNWDRPSESCLATRIPVGTELTVKRLDMVAVMENYWRGCGVESLRVGHDDLVATVIYMPEYADIMKKNRERFAELIKGIGLRSFRCTEWNP